MAPFSKLQLTTRGCEEFRSGTTIRSPVASCAKTIAQTDSMRPVKARIGFMAMSLTLCMKADGAVHGMQRYLRPAFAGAHLHVAAGAVHKPVAGDLTLDGSGKSRHVEIGVYASVHGLDIEVGVGVGMEIDVDRAVHGMKRRFPGGIAAEAHVDAAVH